MKYIPSLSIATEAARKLRKNQTPSEKIFWELIRDRRFMGLKFLRQHTIRFFYEGRLRFFIADFYYPEKKLIIEIDGSVHEKQQEYDRYREYLLGELGYRVIRFQNSELKNIKLVKQKLQEECMRL